MDGQQPVISTPKKSSRLGPLIFVVAIGGPLLYVYGEANEVEAQRECVRRGPPDSSAKTPLQQAQQLGACIHKTSNLLGRQFFAPTFEALNSLPNAPSRWQGVWIAEDYGNPYEFHLCGDSRIRVRPAADPTADDRWRGSWGVHDGQMWWFRNDRGPVLPAEVRDLKELGSDRFSLGLANQGAQEFERSGTRADCGAP